MGSEVEAIISIEKENLTEKQRKHLVEIIDEGEVKDFNDNKELFRAIRKRDPGTTLCSGAEAVGLIAGVLTIYSISREEISVAKNYLDDNDIGWKDITCSVIAKGGDEEAEEEEKVQ